MELKNDFYKNDLNNLFLYWKKNEELNRNTNKKTAEVFSTIYNNTEGRVNRETSLKEMGHYLINGHNSYKSLVEFDQETKPLFDELDKIQNGSKMKAALTKFKHALALTSFKKSGKKDLEDLEQGKLNKKQINTIIEAVLMIEDNIKNDKDASVILDNMKKQPLFKSEYDISSQRANDLKAIKSSIEDNLFVDWLKDMSDFYGVKTMGTILSGNDQKSVEYRNNVLPELDKMVALLDRINLSDNNRDVVYSNKITYEEAKKIDNIKEIINEYKINKMVFDNLKVDVSSQIFIDDIANLKRSSSKVHFNKIENSKSLNLEKNNSFSVDEIPNLKNKVHAYYKENLDNVEFHFNRIENSTDATYSMSNRITDMKMMMKIIEKFPTKVEDLTDELKIEYYKKAVRNSDIAMLAEMDDLKGSFENLKNNGALQHIKNNFRDVPKTSKSLYDANMGHYEESLIKITDWVSKVEEKHGKLGSPLFDENQKVEFDNYSKIAKSYNEYRKQQSLNSNNKLEI